MSARKRTGCNVLIDGQYCDRERYPFADGRSVAQCKDHYFQKSNAWRAANVDRVRTRDRKRRGYDVEAAREREAVKRARRPDLIRARERRSTIRSHGISPEQYSQILANQGGGCAICGSTVPGGAGAHFAIDHDHACCPSPTRSCGKCVRGLLCSHCNNGLGRFKDSPALLERAIAYLKR